MKSIFQTLSILILLLVFASVCLADNNDFATEITQANIHYSNKQYQAAAKAYEDLIKYNNGHLYYNLGNTYYRLGRMGPAILNYLRAKTLIPRDKDLEANLRSAYLETIDHLEEKPSMNIFLSWLDDFNQVETIVAVVATNLLFWLAMIFHLFFRTDFWRLARNTTLCLLLLTLISSGAKHYWNTNHLTGVVLANTVDVKSSPGADGVTLFQLHEGAVAAISERNDDWYQIELPDNKKGWVKKETIGI